jgi:uncharacterized protein YdbL (DUF1318 family)
MHKRFTTLSILVAILSLFLTSSALYAASLKDRMADRIPAINALKDSGLIGENNVGMLEYRTAQKPEQTMVQEENNDRQTVYTAIAQKQGVSPVLVGQRRAQMIAEKGKSGHWYQAADGKWYKK